MKRTFLIDVANWMKEPNRKPLVLRGARQVGKTHLVEKLMAHSFDQIITVNFEKEPEFKDVFNSNLSPAKLLPQLEVILGQRILEGNVLLFFDEIQECPNAISSLRYFYEEMPTLPVIAAGSLLEFALDQASFPVGRVNTKYLRPMSFTEYINARGEDRFAEFLSNHDFLTPLPMAVHQKGLDLCNEYFAIGGMPEVVETFIKTGSLQQARETQAQLCDAYQRDFPKYAKRRSELDNIDEIFHRLPALVGTQVKFSHLSREIRIEYTKAILKLLAKASLVSFAKCTHGIPLGALVNEHNQKPIFLDIGLQGCLTKVNLTSWIKRNEEQLNQGKIAEQFVGQEILAHSKLGSEQLYYWARDKQGSQAEVDFLLDTKDGIVPIEVKYGQFGKLKSLHSFLTLHPQVTKAIKVSSENFISKDPIFSIPFYAWGYWLDRNL